MTNKFPKRHVLFGLLLNYNMDPRRGAWAMKQENPGEFSPSPSYRSAGADGPPE